MTQMDYFVKLGEVWTPAGVNGRLAIENGKRLLLTDNVLKHSGLK